MKARVTAAETTAFRLQVVAEVTDGVFLDELCLRQAKDWKCYR